MELIVGTYSSIPISIEYISISFADKSTTEKIYTKVANLVDVIRKKIFVPKSKSTLINNT